MIVCNVCWVEMNHQTVYQDHLVSPVHLNNILVQKEISSNQPKMPFYCETCSLYTNTKEVLSSHLSSKGHKKKLDLKQRQELLDLNNNLIRNTPASRTSVSMVPKIPISQSCISLFGSNKENQMPDEADKINWETNWCHLCFFEYNSESHKKAHLDGKEHKKKLLLKKTFQRGDFFCAYCCQRQFKSELFEEHLNSQNHFDQIKRYQTYLRTNKIFDYATFIDSSTNRYAQFYHSPEMSTDSLCSILSGSSSSTQADSYKIPKKNAKRFYFNSKKFTDNTFTKKNAIDDSVFFEKMNECFTNCFNLYNLM